MAHLTLVELVFARLWKHVKYIQVLGDVYNFHFDAHSLSHNTYTLYYGTQCIKRGLCSTIYYLINVRAIISICFCDGDGGGFVIEWSKWLNGANLSSIITVLQVSCVVV